MTSVLVVGLDGLEPSLVRRWLDDLPVLRGLIEDGSFGLVRSADPPLSSPAWPWIFTGKQGGKHGCFGFTKRVDDGYERVPVNYSDIHAESLWEALDDAGVSCGVVNVPMTYPPSELEHGYVISGWPVPNRAVVSEPPEVLETVERELGERYRVHPFRMGPELERADGSTVLDAIEDGMWHHERAFEALLSSTDVDVFFCVFMATDVAGHHLGRDPALLKDLYEAQDEALGRLIDSCSQDCDVVVLSDHGHAAVSDHSFYVNEWLREQGYLSVTTDRGVDTAGILRRVGLTRENLIALAGRMGVSDLRRHIPQSIFEVLQRVVPPADARNAGFDPSRIDWANTVAYSPDQNVIYLNTESTHPSGIVDGTEAERYRAEISSKLLEVRHPATDRDEQLVTELGLKETLFEGPYAELAPDIVFIADEMHVTAQASFNDGGVFGPNEWSEHRQYGGLITTGPSFVDADEVENRDIVDVFPLVLSLLDVPIPENVDGAVPSDRFAVAPEPRYRASTDRYEDETTYSASESEDVAEQLRELGYLE